MKYLPVKETFMDIWLHTSAPCKVFQLEASTSWGSRYVQKNLWCLANQRKASENKEATTMPGRCFPSRNSACLDVAALYQKPKAGILKSWRNGWVGWGGFPFDPPNDQQKPETQLWGASSSSAFRFSSPGGKYSTVETEPVGRDRKGC